MIPALTSLADMNLLAAASGAGGLLDALPDPMKLDPLQIGFVIALLATLHFILKAFFFKPLGQVMDQREADMASGAAKRAEAATLVEQRQSEYAARLKELRAKAFDHRKALASQASAERQALLERTRAEAHARREAALEALRGAQAEARTSLLAQVDSLSESMVQHLLR